MSTKVWITLVCLTLFAFLVAWFELLSVGVTAILLISTFVKGQLVIDYFLNLKEVGLLFRLIPTFWLILVISLIAYTYYNPIDTLANQELQQKGK